MSGSSTVLLVEDDPRIASFVARAIGAVGACVEWVTTGSEALDVVATRPIAAVVLDLGLPDV
ncbi:MAG TPA: DNA-binding response regulator, partial [Pseudonocardia sp.]|nr:DNA-binding response regulator [Pseudonocardia sp.]